MNPSENERSIWRKSCRRFNEPGHAHVLTFCCFHRERFLSRDRARLWTLDAINSARQKHPFHVWAYVLMPEHVHLLVHPTTPDYQISAFLASVKIPVARQAAAFVRRRTPEFLDRMADHQPDGRTTLRFWMRGGGYDRNVWEPRYIWEMIDYIHANPIRRGLCERPEDWPWSSARQFLGLEAERLTIDRQSLPEDPRPLNSETVLGAMLSVLREHESVSLK